MARRNYGVDPAQLAVMQQMQREQIAAQNQRMQAILNERVATQRALEQQRGIRNKEAFDRNREVGLRDWRTGQARKDALTQHGEEMKSRAADRAIASIPEIRMAFGSDQKGAENMIRQILTQYADVKGLPAMGTAPPDAATQAAMRFANKTPAVTPPQTGTTPAATQPTTLGTAEEQPPAELTRPYQEPPPVPTGYHWTAGTGGVSGGNNAGMDVTYSDGSVRRVNTSVPGEFPPESGPSSADIINQKRAAGEPYLEGGRVFNPPAGTEGQSYNVSTGEWRPSSLVGTINGVPENLAVAQAALKTGKAPTYASDETYNLYRGLKQNQINESPGGGFAGQPTTPSPELQELVRSGGATGSPQATGGAPSRGPLIGQAPATTTNPYDQFLKGQPTEGGGVKYSISPTDTVFTHPEVGAQGTSTPPTGGPRPGGPIPADYIGHAVGVAAHTVHQLYSKVAPAIQAQGELSDRLSGGSQPWSPSTLATPTPPPQQQAVTKQPQDQIQ